MAQAEADMRIKNAASVEEGVSQLIGQLGTQMREARDYADALLEKARQVLLDAQQFGQEWTAAAQAEHDEIIAKARAHADREMLLADEVAADIVDRAGHEAADIQARAGSILDGLLESASQEAERIRQRDVQRRLENTGQAEGSAALDALLLDFAIGAAPLPQSQGRHVRRTIPAHRSDHPPQLP